MLKEVGEALKTRLASYFNHIEFYEGQFERLDEEVINPPTLYIDYSTGEASETGEVLGSLGFTFYIIASKLDRNPGNMLDILEDTITELNDKGLKDKSNVHLGRVFYRGFKSGVNFPGLIIYEARFSLDRS